MVGEGDLGKVPDKSGSRKMCFLGFANLFQTPLYRLLESHLSPSKAIAAVNQRDVKSIAYDRTLTCF